MVRLKIGLGVNFLETKTGTSQDTVEGRVGGVVTWEHGWAGVGAWVGANCQAALGLNLTCQGRGQRANNGMGKD